jgi:hypothetical protein
MEVAILAVAAATLAVTVFLARLAIADATTQRDIRDAAEATKLAAEASMEAARATHTMSSREYRRSCLRGLEECLVGLLPIVANFHVSALTDDVASLQARMSSYLADIQDELPECRYLARQEMLWSNIAVFNGRVITARHQIHEALRAAPSS